MKLEFAFDKLPSMGQVCHICKLPIEGFVFIPYFTMGGPEGVKYFDYCFCEKCYNEKILETKNQ